LNELCQLRCEDVTQVDGVDVFQIRGERLKSKPSRRTIPIHPTLEKFGFLDYAAAIRSRYGEKGNLFPDLKPSSTGYGSDPLSKDLIRFVQSLGVDTHGGVAHRMRHTFRDALREAEISLDCVKALGGWTRREIHDAYGSGLRVSTLAAAMAKIEFVGLELPSLN
jgi:integrase